MEAKDVVDQCIEFLSLLPSLRNDLKRDQRKGGKLKDIAHFLHRCLQHPRYADILENGLEIDLMSAPNFTDLSVVSAILNRAHREGDRFLSADMAFLKNGDNRSVIITVYRMLLKRLGTQLISVLQLGRQGSILESTEYLRKKIELLVLEDYKILGLQEIPPIKIRGRQGGELILEGAAIDDEIKSLSSDLESGDTQWRSLATLDVSIREERANPFLDYYISVANTFKFNRSLPTRSQTVVLSQKPKTAALCFDRVWAPSEKIVPKPIRCWGATTAEYSMIMNCASIYKKWLEHKEAKKNRTEEETDEMGDDFKRRLYECMARHAMETPYELEYMGSVASEKDLNQTFAEQFRATAVAFSRTHNTVMVPLYGSCTERDKAYSKGGKATILSTLSNLQIVDEKCLTWDQVLEFRKDEKAKKKYERLLHWLKKEMVGKSQSFIEDDVEQKLEDYEWALKKHGIKTVLGEISEVLVGGGIFAIADPKLGLFAAGAIVVGKVVVKVGQALLDFDDIERGPNSEISWVYEVKQLGK